MKKELSGYEKLIKMAAGVALASVVLGLVGGFFYSRWVGGKFWAYGCEQSGNCPEVGSSDNGDLQQQLEDKEKEIQELEAKLQEIVSTKKTLNNQISYFNNQIKLTGLQIAQTEDQIASLQQTINELSAKISELDVDLDNLSKLLVERIVRTYKGRGVDSLRLFLTADGFDDLFSRYKYIRVVQLHDRQVMEQLEQSRQVYDQQKQLKLEKQLELAQLEEKLTSQKSSLDHQKATKEALLEVTKNDEKKYQEMLAAARAEQAAMEQAIADAIMQLKDGTPIEKGEEIALMGNSGAPGCSTAAHLHFEITDKNGVHQNPANYLKPEWNIIWDNSPDQPFALTGNWDWPMQNARITQGYGYTWWANSGFYNGKPHTGIDMVDDESNIIRAPKSGTLYKGHTYCGSSQMNYVAIEHDDVISWYWHVQ